MRSTTPNANRGVVHDCFYYRARQRNTRRKAQEAVRRASRMRAARRERPLSSALGSPFSIYAFLNSTGAQADSAVNPIVSLPRQLDEDSGHENIPHHLTREISQDLNLEIEAENADEAREQAEDEILNLAEDDWRVLQETIRKSRRSSS